MQKKYEVKLTEAERLRIFNTVDAKTTPKTIRKTLLIFTSKGRLLAWFDFIPILTQPFKQSFDTDRFLYCPPLSRQNVEK